MQDIEVVTLSNARTVVKDPAVRELREGLRGARLGMALARHPDVIRQHSRL